MVAVVVVEPLTGVAVPVIVAEVLGPPRVAVTFADGEAVAAALGLPSTRVALAEALAVALPVAVDVAGALTVAPPEAAPRVALGVGLAVGDSVAVFGTLKPRTYSVVLLATSPATRDGREPPAPGPPDVASVEMVPTAPEAAMLTTRSVDE